MWAPRKAHSDKKYFPLPFIQCIGVGNMENTEPKIVLPEKLQIEMLKFFLKTSIPRKKKAKKDV